MTNTKTDDVEPYDEFELHAREITMSDGRYMIFYTFGEEADEEAEVREDV